MDNNRNFLITIALSILILVVWQVFYMNPRIEAQREAAQIEAQQSAETANQSAGQAGEGAATGSDIPTAQTGGEAASIPGASSTAGAPATREDALAQGQRIRIETPRLVGSINLTGARIDDLRLKDYRVTVEKDSPIVTLLNPGSLNDGYYVETGYVGASAGDGPGPDTQWQVEEGAVLSPGNPVVLSYTNDSNVTFRRTISVDDNYLFTVSDSIENAGSARWSCAPMAAPPVSASLRHPASTSCMKALSA